MGYTAHYRRGTQPRKRYVAHSVSDHSTVTLKEPAWLQHATQQQNDIFRMVREDPRNLIVLARAGTGKTSTSLEAIRQLLLVQPYLKIAFLTFTKSVATELQAKVPAGVTASTNHSHGFSAIRDHARANGRSVKVNDNKMFWALPRDIEASDRSLIAKIATKCKLALLDGTNRDELDDLCFDNNIDLGPDEDKSDFILRMVPEALRLSRENTAEVDYADMIWLPVIDPEVRRYITRYDILFQDEAQDMNPCQQRLMMLSAKRLVIVGDDLQAIMAFAGADSDSMANIERMLCEHPLGCVTLPLTITQRCGKLIVAYAREDAPDYEAADNAPIGHICFGDSIAVFDPESNGFHIEKKPANETEDFMPMPGDMVVCRTNAPLIRYAYVLIRENIPVRILGKEFGEGLAKFVKEHDTDGTVPTLLDNAYKFQDEQSKRIVAAKKRADEKLAALQDRIDCIEALCEGLDTVTQVQAKINSLFSDDTSDVTKHVRLSSIHKAKGLEAGCVRIIEPGLLPHPMAKGKQIEQEYHLRYVARTRLVGDGWLHIH